MQTIGLTGGIGSGKSRVAAWFAKEHIPVLDADLIVHELMEQDGELIQSLIEEFGPGIRDHHNGINRRALGRIVFDHEEARVCLEQLVHPRLFQVFSERQRELINRGYKACIWDVPLLLESKMESSVNEVWVVWAALDTRIQRVRLRDKLSKDAVLKRINAQIPLEMKVEKADVVIDNSGSWAETEVQLAVLCQKLNGSLI